jgi:hypothetical protein
MQFKLIKQFTKKIKQIRIKKIKFKNLLFLEK